MKPTEKQIKAEISALEACKSYAPPMSAFNEDNHRKLDLQIEFLHGHIDTSAEEFYEDYTEDEQSAILDAEEWQEGQFSEPTLSGGWDNFKPKKKTKSKR